MPELHLKTKTGTEKWILDEYYRIGPKTGKLIDYSVTQQIIENPNGILEHKYRLEFVFQNDQEEWSYGMLITDWLS